MVRATRPLRTSATPTMNASCQNVVAVLKRSGSQCAPSGEVQTGLEDAPHPTAMNPPRQRRTEWIKPNDSLAANLRQWMAAHAASAAGGTGVVKAVTSAGDCAGLGAAIEGSLEGAIVAGDWDGGDATGGVEVADASGDAGDASGTGEVVVPQPARAITLSAIARC
jgi:hypothetical protein